jgi:hypothetical protein
MFKIMKKYTIFLFLMFFVISCEDIDTLPDKKGNVSFRFELNDFNNSSTSNSRLSNASDWKHIFKDKAILKINNTKTGEVFNIEYSPENITNSLNIELPYGTYNFESIVSGSDFESFLGYELSGSFELLTPSIILDVNINTNYGLVTVNDNYVKEVYIMYGGNKINLFYSEDMFHYFIYVKNNLNINLSIIENIRETEIKRNLIIKEKTHYNFKLFIPIGVLSDIEVIIEPFDLIEEEIEILGYEFKEGDKLIITAEPRPGYYLSHWSVDGEIINKPGEWEFIMPNRDVEIIAYFEKF